MHSDQHQGRDGARQARRYLRECLRPYIARRVARWLGREGEPLRAIDHLLDHNLLHILTGQPVRRLTVSRYLHGEGGGSKALMVLFVQGLCARLGVPYVHTPFRDLAHADRPQAAFDAAWEDFFQLGAGLPRAGIWAADTYDYFMLSHVRVPAGGDLTQLIEGAGGRIRLPYYLEIASAGPPPVQAFMAQEFVATLQAALPTARARFRARWPRAANPVFTVALHIRRGDVGPERADMWTGIDRFAGLLDQIDAAMRAAGQVYALHLHSEGEAADFAALARFRPVLHLNDDPIVALGRLVAADLLLMSKSCFSYVAGLYGDACVVCEEGALPPLPGWIVCDQSGTIDRAALESGIARALTGPRP